MVSCPKCGKGNPDDASFCTSCGMSLSSDIGSTIERQAKQFAQNMEQASERVGEQITQAARQLHDATQKEARQIEQRMDRVSRQVESRYAKAFGPFGPLIESFIFLIVFRLVLLVMEVPHAELPELNSVAALLLGYLVPLFVLNLLSNYIQYLSRRFFQVKVFSPLFYALLFVIFCWVITRILTDASNRFSNSDILTAAQSLENSLPTIFIVVLLIGYIVLILNLPKDRMKREE